MGQRPVGTRRGVEQTPSIVSPKDATKARLVDVERRFQSTAKGGTPMHHDRSNLLNPSTEPSIDALRAGAPFTVAQFFFLLLSLVRPLREMHLFNWMEVKW